MKTVVVVDDDKLDLKMLTRVFEREAPEVSISTCLGSAGAVEKILELKSDVVLLDINMPGLNGFEVLEMIRQKNKTNLPPVIMLSTSESDRDIQQSYAAGAAAYIVKPNTAAGYTDLARSIASFWIDVARKPSNWH